MCKEPSHPGANGLIHSISYLSATIAEWASQIQFRRGTIQCSHWDLCRSLTSDFLTVPSTRAPTIHDMDCHTTRVMQCQCRTQRSSRSAVVLCGPEVKKQVLKGRSGLEVQILISYGLNGYRVMKWRWGNGKASKTLWNGVASTVVYMAWCLSPAEQWLVTLIDRHTLSTIRAVLSRCAFLCTGTVKVCDAIVSHSLFSPLVDHRL